MAKKSKAIKYPSPQHKTDASITRKKPLLIQNHSTFESKIDTLIANLSRLALILEEQNARDKVDPQFLLLKKIYC